MSAQCAFPRVGTSLFSWEDSHPYLAGLISGLGAWALQLTSIHYIRRRWFDVSPLPLIARWPAMATRSRRIPQHTVTPFAVPRLCTEHQKPGPHSQEGNMHEVLPSARHINKASTRLSP